MNSSNEPCLCGDIFCRRCYPDTPTIEENEIENEPTAMAEWCIIVAQCQGCAHKETQNAGAALDLAWAMRTKGWGLLDGVLYCASCVVQRTYRPRDEYSCE